MTDLPFVGQKFWGHQLNQAIELRDSETLDEVHRQVADPNSPIGHSLMDTIATGVTEQVPGKVAEALAEDDTIRQAAVNAMADEATRVEALKETFVQGQTRPASPGALTDGDIVRIGRHAYSANVGGTTYVQGGATNQENVIGGNIAAVRTSGTNLDPAVMNDGANRSWSAILHGYDNVNNGWANIFAGYHLAAETESNHVTLLGGASHYADATCEYGTAIGGLRARLSGIAPIVAGGEENEATATHAAVFGGFRNKATAAQAHVLGGQQNEATDFAAAIIGGLRGTATHDHALIGNGADNLAAGDRATIVNGNQNQATAADAFIGGGIQNKNSGLYGFLGNGYMNEIRANFGTILGGRESLIDTAGTYGTAVGRNAKAEHFGVFVHSTGQFAAPGDAQSVRAILRHQTTNATPVALRLDGANYRLTLAANTTWAVTGTVAARRVDGGAQESAAFRVSALITRTTTSPVMVGTPEVEVIAASPGAAAWALSVSADVATGSLALTATGEDGKTIRWVASLEIVQVQG